MLMLISQREEVYQKSRICSRAWFACSEKCTPSQDKGFQLLFASAEEYHRCWLVSTVFLKCFSYLLKHCGAPFVAAILSIYTLQWTADLFKSLLTGLHFFNAKPLLMALGK